MRHPQAFHLSAWWEDLRLEIFSRILRSFKLLVMENLRWVDCPVVFMRWILFDNLDALVYVRYVHTFVLVKLSWNTLTALLLHDMNKIAILTATYISCRGMGKLTVFNLLLCNETFHFKLAREANIYDENTTALIRAHPSCCRLF